MYKIKNITRGKLLLGDLGLKLDAGETVDLDAVRSRDQVDASVNLKVAEENELVAILHKDVIKPTTALSFDPTMFFEMERRIREQIVQQMQPAPVATPAPQPVSNDTDVTALTAKLSELIMKMGTGGNNIPQSSAEVEEYTPDDDKLREVHAKALKRMTKGASGHIESKEKTTESNVSDRASELDDFLK